MLFIYNKTILTLAFGLLAGEAVISRLAEAAAGRPREHGHAVVPAGDAAAWVELLQVLLPCLLQERQPGVCLSRRSAETHQLVDWQGLTHYRVVLVFKKSSCTQGFKGSFTFNKIFSQIFFFFLLA